MRVIITGGTGFLGRPFVSQLLDHGHQVLLLARHAPPDSPAPYLVADLGNPATYRAALEAFAPDVACHLAWEGIPDFSAARCEHNVALSLAFLDEVTKLASCRKIIGAGSCWEYGLREGPCLETAEPIAVNDFTRAKNAIRQFGMSRAEQAGKRFGWFRIFFVYGPGQRKGSLIPSAIEACRRGEALQLQNPNAAQDFVFLDDVVEGLIRAVEGDWPSGSYNLGTGSLTALGDVVRMVELVMNDSTRVPQAGDSPKAGGIWAVTELSRRCLHWQPRTTLADGLRKTLAQEPRP